MSTTPALPLHDETPSRVDALIAGAGPAGLTLALRLLRAGKRPLVIERADHIRTDGYTIDFFGTGYDVASRMGLIEALQARHVPVTRVRFVGSEGETRGEMSLSDMRELLDGELINFARGELVDVLHKAAQAEGVPIRTGAWITSVEGVEGDGPARVMLSSGEAIEADVVVGADGVHSGLRELLFCREAEVARFLGYHCGAYRIPRAVIDADEFCSYSEPGRLISCYPLDAHTHAIFFMYTSDAPELPPREARREAVLARLDGMGWRAAELLAHLPEDLSDLYLDTVTQIRLDTWHRGRAVLLGDAAHCMTLLSGQGASFALGGAYILADALAQHPDDLTAAFSAYQAHLFDEVRRRQDNVLDAGRFFCPGSRLAILARDLFSRVAFWPLIRQITRQQLGAESVL